jgi:anthranilate phosphoribosyltransferase
VFELRDGDIRTFDLDPELLGLPLAHPASLVGGDAAYNAAVVRRVVAGERGPVRDIVMLNAAAALVAADAVVDLADGVARAAAALDDGAAAAVLERFVAVSRDAAEAGA